MYLRWAVMEIMKNKVTKQFEQLDDYPNLRLKDIPNYDPRMRERYKRLKF